MKLKNTKWMFYRRIYNFVRLALVFIMIFKSVFITFHDMLTWINYWHTFTRKENKFGLYENRFVNVERLFWPWWKPWLIGAQKARHDGFKALRKNLRGKPVISNINAFIQRNIISVQRVHFASITFSLPAVEGLESVLWL